MIIYVAFSDSTEETVSTVFTCEQDPEVWENLGEVEEDDIRYITFMDSMKSLFI